MSEAADNDRDPGLHRETTSLPPLDLPSDRRLVRVAEAAREALATRGGYAVVGAAGSGTAMLARALLAAGATHVLYVAPSHDVAQRAVEDLKALAALGLPGGAGTDDPAPLFVSTSETSPYADVHPDRRQAMQRAAALFTMAKGLPWRIAVTTPSGLLRRTAPPAALAHAGLELAKDGELDVERAAHALTASGYLRAPVVEDPGSFAVRGGVLDIWPAHLEQPLRAELYGDLVLSLKRFDPDTQRTLAEERAVWLPPAREAVLERDTVERARARLRTLCDDASYPSTKARALIDDLAFGRSFFGSDGYLPAFYELVPLLSYLPRGAAVVFDDPVAVARALTQELEQAAAAEAARGAVPHFPVAELYAELGELERDLATRVWVGAHRSGIVGTGAADLVSRLETAAAEAPSLAQDDHSELGRAVKLARTARGKHAALDPLVERFAAWKEHGFAVVPVARTATQADRIALLLKHRGVETEVRVAPLGRGCLAPLEALVLVTDEEIFGPRALRAPPRRTSTRALLEDLRALSPGDFVVHVEHGIGKYAGLERREVGGVGLELIVVEYAGGDKLFLPVYRLNQIQKYSGSESAPKLDRLGGQTFAKTKASVARRVRQMADELLRLYAERAALEKSPVPPPDDDYATFEASFPFEETRDQAAAISEVLKDLENPRVMDRLVCGDVGFGKTEVALRAAFRMASSGRQVAVLCPTTVLAQQHFLTFSQRFAEWPLNVRVLSRFSSKTEQLETVKGLREGGVDVVVGTHRLLSKDVHFKQLGLLVVDEEQRFGVGHKERIKQIRSSVDVLTLSATPIPRTLQLAVGGLRDMSIIATPPVDRRTIRTITSQFDPTLVREAVEQELARGGQIFYVYNRVEGIYERAERLGALVPGARIAVAHGKLTEDVLERTMLGFVGGDYDVLVATAIIESGLDIPRANTIIIDRADMLGLSQLYQLRGRVGRARERAYCYLLVPPPSQLSDEARQRLEALERFSELGSGFHLATLDMELRGAGDVLGADQSGFAASVGFELFCRMLEEATRELRGETVVHEVEPELHFDVEALLAAEYVAEVGVRLSLYKRFASAVDEAEVDDLAQELENRFGPPPLEAKRFVELMRLKVELRRLRVLGCEATAKSVSLLLRDDTPLDPGKVRELVARKRSPYRLSPDGRLTRRLLETEAAADGLVLAAKTLEELNACVSAAS
ncbi:MAG TPA: transcription-repair coupling factor [Polyangiaceae bacterium]|nr:transcription-repair coupling factor [Polyangiaceae bacterium]